MNTKTSNNSLLYRIAAIFVIVMMLLAAMPVSPAFAAVATGQAWSSIYAGAAFPGTLTYTVNAGTNRMLVVGVSSSRTTAGTQTVAVTYGGQALTQQVGDGGTTAQQHTYLFYLKDTPAVMNGAAQNLVVTFTASGTSYYNFVYAAVYTGVDQSATPITNSRNYTSGNAAVGAGTIAFGTSLTVNAGDQAVEMVNLMSSSSTTIRTLTPGANWSTPFAPTGFSGGGTSANAYAVVRTQPAANTTDVSTHTISSNNTWASMSGMSIKAAVAALTPTTTTITSDTPDPSVVGQNVVVNFTVTAGAAGNVTVSDGVNNCTGTVATGTCTLALATAGARTLTATYAGNATYAGSTSAGVAHTVNKADTTTTITNAAALGTASVVGQPYAVNYAVAVTAPGAGTPTGNVTVSDGVATCTGTVAAGTCNLTSTSAGAKTITATYVGDANFNTSASAGVAHTVNKANTTTAINSDTPDPSLAGANVVVNFTVAAVAPGAGTRTGNVTVTDGVNSCSGAVTAAGTGTCTLALTTVGARTLTATYVGDTNFNGSASAGAAHTVTASFILTASASAGGTITPSGAVAVVGGANQTFSSAPNATFILSDVSVDSVSVGRANSYTFSAVAANHTIAASFNGGWSAPTAFAVVGGAPTTPNNTFSSDNIYGYWGSGTDAVNYTSFGLPAIPVGATINGIEVGLEGYNGQAGGRNLQVQLSWNGGTTFTTITAAKTTNMPIAEGTVVLGGAADTWGRTWTNTEFTNANFVLRATATGGPTPPVYIDQLQVKVTYTLPVVAPTITSANATTFTAGVAGNFNVTATGSPAPTFTEAGALPAGVTLSAAGVLSGTPAAGTVGSYPITITASNGTLPNATQAFTLTVQKANTTTTITSDTPDPSLAGQNVVVNYTVASAGNSLAFTGNVTVSDGVNNCVGTPAAGTCTLALTTFGARTLTATYAGDANFNGSASAGAAHTVNSAPPTITSAAPSNGTQGFAYNHTYTATGTTPITFSVTSGALPTGLTLSSAGVISGTPTVLGTFNGVVTAANGTLPNATQNFSITISLSPTITSANSTSFTVGVAGTFTVTATGSPAPTLSMTGALPTGVSFVPATGILSGTPAAGTGGNYPLTFTATNGVLPDAVQSFTLTVTDGPSITSANNTTFSLGLAGTFTVTTAGSPAPTLSMTGSLPSGVSFAPATGILSGTPAAGTVGTYPLTFTAVNGTLPNATQAFTLTVKNGPVVMPNGINSYPDTGNGSISSNESIVNTLSITTLFVKFDQNVYDPAGDTDPKDVTNPANYVLVMSSSAGAFQTVSCLGGVQAPDVAIPVASVTYNNSTFTATVNMGSPINVVGFYRLYVCGTTSIVDANNINLDLAGNGTTPGTDFLLSFRVQTRGAAGGGGGNNAAASSLSTKATLIPVTGFAPNKVTILPKQPANKAYKSLGEIRIEIPALGINYPIVGVMLDKSNWDLTWLKDSVGYLEGSTYPTMAGNSVLTAHVRDANNHVGPFSDIKGLQTGQKIYIHANGQVYVYQVQENEKILASDISAAFKHEENSWITLVTCEDYNAKTELYTHRRMVRAVLISIVSEK